MFLKGIKTPVQPCNQLKSLTHSLLARALPAICAAVSSSHSRLFCSFFCGCTQQLAGSSKRVVAYQLSDMQKQCDCSRILIPLGFVRGLHEGATCRSEVPREARDLSGMFTVPLACPCIQLTRALYSKGDSCRRSEQTLQQFIRR